MNYFSKKNFKLPLTLIHVQDIEVGTGDNVETVGIYRIKESGVLVGLDGAQLQQSEDGDIVFSPYNKGIELQFEEDF